MRRIERVWGVRACRIWGSLIVATEPVAARRRCGFWSLVWAEAVKGGLGGRGGGVGLEAMAGWCDVLYEWKWRVGNVYISRS